MATDDNSLNVSEAAEGSEATAQVAHRVHKIDRFLEAVIKFEGSDLHMKADVAPRIRKAGKLRALTSPPVPNEDMVQIVKEILDADQWHSFSERGAIDVAYALSLTDRFRMNIFRQRGQISLAARRINPRIPSYSQLNLPAIFEQIAANEQGLVLICGITGSGKSTTLAAMIEQINTSRACHIVTIEDPIEYLYVDKKAYVNQREIGLDVESYESAIRSLMREDPDVILIGEMRDQKTFQTALQAAETGHLVFSTIHASSAPGALTRILELFPTDMHTNIRQALVANLKAIVYQKLVRSVKPGADRVPVVEVMLSSPAVRKYIEDGRESELVAVIRAEKAGGMIDFNDMLAELVQQEVVQSKEAYAASPNPDELRMRMRGIKTN
jgi:twitching motility protein PilT